MLKKYLFLLILFVLIIKLESQIQPNNYCLKSTKECSEKFKKACGSDYCATNSKTCLQLMKFKFFIEEILKLNLNRMQKLYKKLTNSFVKCPEPKISSLFEFKLNEVCIPRMDCFKKRQSVKLVSKCACPDGQHSTPCSKRFCVKNEKNCREFESKSAANKSILLQIKYCA